MDVIIANNHLMNNKLDHRPLLIRLKAVIDTVKLFQGR